MIHLKRFSVIIQKFKGVIFLFLSLQFYTVSYAQTDIYALKSRLFAKEITEGKSFTVIKRYLNDSLITKQVKKQITKIQKQFKNTTNEEFYCIKLNGTNNIYNVNIHNSIKLEIYGNLRIGFTNQDDLLIDSFTFFENQKPDKTSDSEIEHLLSVPPPPPPPPPPPVKSKRLSTKQSNLHLIDSIKTSELAGNINKLLLGYWEFTGMKDPKGNTIDTLFHYVDNMEIGFESVERPNYFFGNDSSYTYGARVLEDSIRPDPSAGIWFYDQMKKELILEFNEPVQADLSGLDSTHIERLKSLGLFEPVSSTFIEIHKISPEELIIIEHRPHNEFELIYNLLYYKKIIKD